MLIKKDTLPSYDDLKSSDSNIFNHHISTVLNTPYVFGKDVPANVGIIRSGCQRHAAL